MAKEYTTEVRHHVHFLQGLLNDAMHDKNMIEPFRQIAVMVRQERIDALQCAIDSIREVYTHYETKKEQ